MSVPRNARNNQRVRGGPMLRSSGFTNSLINTYHGKPRVKVSDDRRVNGPVIVLKPAPKPQSKSNNKEDV
jgi:hypothetical protein